MSVFRSGWMIRYRHSTTSNYFLPMFAAKSSFVFARLFLPSVLCSFIIFLGGVGFVFVRSRRVKISKNREGRKDRYRNLMYVKLSLNIRREGGYCT